MEPTDKLFGLPTHKNDSSSGTRPDAAADVDFASKDGHPMIMKSLAALEKVIGKINAF